MEIIKSIRGSNSERKILGYRDLINKSNPKLSSHQRLIKKARLIQE